MTTKELQGVAHELQFWMRFVKEDRFLKGWVPDIVTPELHPEARNIISELLPQDGKVLDVGSGVVSILRGFISQQHLFAADPLAELYGLIFNYGKYKIWQPVAVPAEELILKFGCDCFDIVHCSNALDHTQNPEIALTNMLSVVKPGGYLIVQGFENEGQHENYEGFHQWNISMYDMILEIKDKDNKSVFAIGGEWERCVNLPIKENHNWYIWTIKK